MDQWLSTPAIVVAVLAILTLAWRFGYWMSNVNKDRSSMRESLQGFRKDVKEDIARVEGELAGVREELKGELAGVREELKGELAGVREELKGEIAGVRGELKGEIAGVRGELAEVRSDIKQILLHSAPSIVQENSPLRLTDLGERIAEFLNVHEWASEHAGILLPRAKGLKPYQIDSLCERYLLTEVKRGPGNIEECAYEFGIIKGSIYWVLRVVLRDELLKRTGQAD